MNGIFIRLASLLFLLNGIIAGCSSRPQNSVLTTGEALVLAAQLANERALELFKIQPFQTNHTEIKRTEEGWRWHALVGRGKADLVADVTFFPDGSHPQVVVEMHTSEVMQPLLRPPFRPSTRPLEPRPIPEHMPEDK